MNGRRATLGLCTLCALIASAVTTQEVTAATSGTTAFTCKEVGAGGGFTKAHCSPGDIGSGNFSHVAIEQNSTTEVEASNLSTAGERESAKIKFTIGGMALEFAVKKLDASGWLTNAKDSETGEHYVHGEGVLTLTEISNSVCGVYTDSGGSKGEKGVVHTEPLIATTKGQGDFINFSPKEGTVFTRFTLEECGKTGSVSGTYELIGSIKGTLEGATVNFTHAGTTAQETLKLNGAIKTGIEGRLTVSGRSGGAGPYTALGATTVETS